MAAPSLIEVATRHQSHYERLKSAEVKLFDDFLKQMDRDLRLQLSGEVTDFTRTKLEKQIKQIGALIGSSYDDYQKVWKDSITEAALYEAGFEHRSLGKVVDGVEFSMPSDSQITAAVFNTPLGDIGGASGGQLLEPFFDGMKTTQVKRIEGAIRLGYAEGQTTAKIVQRIRGTRAAGYSDGLWAASKRDVEAVTRTALQHAASQARGEVWKKNSKVIKGVKIVATLDSKTSPQCRSLDSQVFPMDKGPRPPFHVNACLKGTLIKTKLGDVRIEDVKVGDLVRTHEGRWRPVTAVMARHHEGLARDLINNLGSCVRLTNEHPILTKSKGWIEAGDVKAGDVLFHDGKELPYAYRGKPPPFIPQTVLSNSHNMETSLTDELISYGIFSLTRGVSSSVKLNSGVTYKEIGVVGEEASLANVLCSDAVENRREHSFMLGWISKICSSYRIAHLLNNFRIMGRIDSSHPFGCFGVTFFRYIRHLLSPVVISRRVVNKFLAINNRFSPSFCGNAMGNAELPDSVITKAIFPFDLSKAFPFAPVLVTNKLFDLFKSYHKSPRWYAATCSSIVEYHYSGMVYNLAVQDDETYIANGVVVHNCRTSTTAVLIDEYADLSKGRTRSQRDPETGKVGKTSAKTTYYDWLKRQPASVQNSIIGPTRGKLLRNGGISSERFAELQLGKNFDPLTLDEMRKLEPIAFSRANI